MKTNRTRIFSSLTSWAAILSVAAVGWSQGCGRAASYTGPSLVQHVDADAFNEIVDRAAVPVVVNFWAPWCPPCRALSPTLDKLSAEFEDRLTVLKVNVDDNQALAESLEIRSIPATLVFKEGRSVDSRIGGGREDDFREWFAAQL